MTDNLALALRVLALASAIYGSYAIGLRHGREAATDDLRSSNETLSRANAAMAAASVAIDDARAQLASCTSR